jgi:hypothetical protein
MSGTPSAAATDRSVVAFSNPLEDDRRMTPEENTDFNNLFGFARKFTLEDLTCLRSVESSDMTH